MNKQANHTVEKAENSIIIESLLNLFRKLDNGQLSYSSTVLEISKLSDIAPECAELNFFKIYCTELQALKNQYKGFFDDKNSVEVKCLQDIANEVVVSIVSYNYLKPRKYYVTNKNELLKRVSNVFFTFLELMYKDRMKKILDNYQELEKDGYMLLKELFMEITKRINIFDSLYRDKVAKENFFKNIICVKEISVIDNIDYTDDSRNWKWNALKLCFQNINEYNNDKDKTFASNYAFFSDRMRTAIGITEDDFKEYRVNIKRLKTYDKISDKNISSNNINKIHDCSNLLTKIKSIIINIISEKTISFFEISLGFTDIGIDNLLDRLLLQAEKILPNSFSDIHCEMLKISRNKNELKKIFKSHSQYDLFIQTRLYQYIEPYLNFIIDKNGELDDEHAERFLNTFQSLNELLETKIQKMSKEESLIKDIEFNVIDKEIKKALEEEKKI